MKALIIGSNSDIAKAAIDRLKILSDIVIGVNRSDVDLASDVADQAIRNLLIEHKPDFILHSAGVFKFNAEADYDETFDVNLKSQWTVIDHYLKNPPDKPVRFAMIGSMTYQQGRKNFILYAASRAALFSVWQGASEAAPENLKLGLINPVRVNTKQVAHLVHPYPEICLEPDDVAEEIVKLTKMTDHTLVDMEYKRR